MTFPKHLHNYFEYHLLVYLIRIGGVKITTYTTGEREIAIELIEKLKQMGLKNDLILFDRGYPSRKFFAYLEGSGVKYLMRVKNQSMKEINEATESDQIVEMKIDGKTIKVRVIRFMLDSETEEVLVTNLWDENLGIQEFKALYFKRWGLEVKFDELKNRLQLQNFTCVGVVCRGRTLKQWERILIIQESLKAAKKAFQGFLNVTK